MYGNAKALADINAIADDKNKADIYSADANEMKSLVEKRLWSEKDKFFETMRGDTLAAVREAIGFIPWYFNIW